MQAPLIKTLSTSLVAVLLTACGSTGEIQSLGDYGVVKPNSLEQSQEYWRELAEQSAGNYQYAVDFHSISGFGHSTLIQVENNRVVARHFSEWRDQGPPTLIWSEDQSNLGSHQGAASVSTIDQLYQTCRSQVLPTSNTDRYRVTLSYDALGVLQVCSYRDTLCVDDCSRGVNISKLKILLPE